MPTTIDDIKPLLADPLKFRRLLADTEGGWDDGGNVTALATFKTSYRDAWTFLRACQGRAEVVGSQANGAALVRLVPLQFPENPALYAYAGGVRYRGGTTDPAAPYSWAECRIQFRFPPFNMEDGDWTSYQMQIAGTEMTRANVPYTFGDGYPTGADVAVVVPEQELVYTRHWVPNLEQVEPLITAMSGRVNSATFRGNPPGTVLFAGGATNASVSLQGKLTQDVQLKFMYRRTGFNSFLHPVSGTFLPVYDPVGNLPIPDDTTNTLDPLLRLADLLTI